MYLWNYTHIALGFHELNTKESLWAKNKVEHLREECPNLMKPKSRETLGENIDLAHKPKSYMYKHMRPNVKIYKHIPLEREIRMPSHTSWRWEGEIFVMFPWRNDVWPWRMEMEGRKSWEKMLEERESENGRMCHKWAYEIFMWVFRLVNKVLKDANGLSRRVLGRPRFDFYVYVGVNGQEVS